MQAQIYCHLDNTTIRKSPNGGTFSKKYAHGCICVVYEYCKNMNQLLEKSTLKNLEHLEITKSTNPILSKSYTLNNVILFSREHW
jgi:hypothetical protein